MNEEILKELEIHNRKLISLFEKQNDGLSSLSEKIEELINKQYEVNFPEQIKAEITNQKEIVLPQTQDVKIVNQQGYPTEIKISNLPKQKDFPSEIKVSNLPKPQSDKGLREHLTKLFTGIWEATKEHTAKIFITNRTPKEAIPVVLVDAEGKQKYTAIFSGGGSGGGGTSGTQDVNILSEVAPSTLVAFITDIPTAGARVQLATNVIIAGIIEAPSTNTGNVYIGGSDVSSTVFGSELQPGQSAGIAINNTNKIYIDAATSGDDVAFFGS